MRPLVEEEEGEEEEKEVVVKEERWYQGPNFDNIINDNI